MSRNSHDRPSPTQLRRRLALLPSRRARVQEAYPAYEAGSYTLPELRKGVDELDSERRALELEFEAAGPPEIEESACVDLAYAFVRWGG